MKDKLHIIIAGEKGLTKSIVVSKYRLGGAFCIAVATLLVLSAMSFTGIKLFFHGAELRTRTGFLESSLNNERNQKEKLVEQVAQLEMEKQILLKDAVTELEEKSQLIESILSSVGVDVKVSESQQNSGGPFTSMPGDDHEDLLFKAGLYLDTIKDIPLGAPIQGGITSKFGRRIDPFNKRPALHDGVDIRGKRGTKAFATADGLVVQRGYNRGYGNFVVIGHGSGFRTKFGHFKKILVKKGEKIKRGQVIGLVGNSGRSTGPHLHYEIIYNGEPTDPIKFMRFAQKIR